MKDILNIFKQCINSANCAFIFYKNGFFLIFMESSNYYSSPFVNFYSLNP